MDDNSIVNRKDWEENHFRKFGNIMVDIETLSVHTNASIISIAAVEFNPITAETGLEFHYLIDFNEWGKNNRHIEGRTVKWWMEQDKTAQGHLFSLKPVNGFASCKSTLMNALCAFARFVADCDTQLNNDTTHKERVKLWGNGSTMDISILQSAYEHFEMETPWQYWAVNDVRTIVDLNPSIKESFKNKFKGVKHDALDDCKHQISYLSATLNTISIKN